MSLSCRQDSTCFGKLQQKNRPGKRPRGLTNLLLIAILNIERALPVVGWTLVSCGSNRQLWGLGRLLLFIIDRNNEADNADDN